MKHFAAILGLVDPIVCFHVHGLTNFFSNKL